jgi:peptidoglycan hydrolase-like protein with peptidoglycan-binding domain
VRLLRKQLGGWLFLIAVGLWILPAGAVESAHRTPKPAQKKTKTVHHRSSSRRHATRRRSRYRYRLARMQPEPDRIVEIQQALIREGYLKQEASGKWDDATRTAMRDYQQANGFEVTGLPEAKALMKLGLGPHPLPEDVDPRVVGRASALSPPTTSTDPAAKGTSDPR